MKERKVKNKKRKIINQLAILFVCFLVFMLTIAAMATYNRQSWIYKDMCTQRIMSVGDYLTNLMIREGDFAQYVEYYSEHYEEMRIPFDFDECDSARNEFESAFAAEYPGKTLGKDVQISELSDDLKRMYFTYRHEYWILTFEQARESFELPYTYFLTIDEVNHNVVYMIDGERTEDEEHPGYLYLGDTYYNDPDSYAILWNTWATGQKQEGVKEFDNSWGHTYAYYTPLVTDGQKLGLVAAEIDVQFVKKLVVRSTIMLCLRLGVSLLIFSSLLLYAIYTRYIKKINYLSGQIDSFSSTRALETVNAIREYKFENDELGTLADNTADMITEIKEHEDAIQKAADMKSDFLANMSHEIRTPMNAVVGMSQLILREDISPKARDYATQIKASGNDLLTIINDILDFSKIESGNMDIVPARYEPAVLVKEVANLLALNNKNPNLEIKTEINPSLPAVLEGDSTRIRQILTNIMSNAVKFTKEGSVLVSVDYDRLDERNLMLRMEVADTGIGISKNDLNSIFESFSQVNSTRNREVEGTGLGLAITKRLVELMDGTIGVESESGKGSVFTVEIPQFIISDEPPIHSDADGKEDAAAEFSAPNAKVLVVDDNQVNLFIMNGMLEIYGIKPVSVESGERAIEEAGKDDYDIFFMDHMMPKMDGVEAARQILEKYPAYKDIPMIAFTANALEESKQKLLKEGFNDFLSKPVEPEKLTEMLMKWLPSEKIIKL